MKKMLFVVNPKAGKTTLKNSLTDVIDIFIKNDYEVTIHITQNANDASRIAKDRSMDFDVIVCAGGDGTLANVINGIMQLPKADRVPVGYIPCGSTNDYARSLDIPDVGIKAARKLVKAQPFAVDIGHLTDKFFVYVAAFGIFSDVSYATPQNMKNMLGHGAYVLQGIKSVINIPSYHLVIEHDNEVEEDDFIYGMVSNSVSVGGYKSMVRNGVEFDDGLFECLFIRKIRNPADLNRTVGSFIGGYPNDKNMVCFRTSNVKIRSDKELAWTLDGEFGGNTTDCEIEIIPRAIDILVSAEEGEE